MILVTGGCGFIGANLVKKLKSEQFEVRVFDNLTSGNVKHLKGLKIDFVEGDLRDKIDVQNALKDVDAVIHLAAYGGVIDSIIRPYDNFDVNVFGTFNLLNECKIYGIKDIIFSSTGGALMGNCEQPVNEKTLPNPISPYGSGKLCGESYCSSFAHSYNMNITVLRFANIFGPLSYHKKGAVTEFMKAILRNEPLEVYGDGSATRDFLYVDDLCSGIMKTIENTLNGFNTLHLSSGRQLSINELANEITSIAGFRDYPIRYVHSRVGEIEHNFADYALAKRTLGFEPLFSLKEALSITWEWFIKTFEEEENFFKETRGARQKKGDEFF